MVDEALAKAERKAQSLVDTGANRLSKKVQQQIATLEQSWKLQEAAGIPVPTPEQQQAARRQVVESALLTEDEPSATGQVQTQVAEDVEAVNRKIQALYQSYGMEIYPTDPEAAPLLKAETLSGDEFATLLEQQLQAKAARTGQPIPVQSQVNQSARVPTSAGSAGRVPQVDLQQQYQQELATAPRGNIDAINAVKLKYRQKGLDVW
jgi:hypothetical protein